MNDKNKYPFKFDSDDLEELCKEYLWHTLWSDNGWSKGSVHNKICEILGIRKSQTTHITDNIFTSLELPQGKDVRTDWWHGYYGRDSNKEGLYWKVLLIDYGLKLKEMLEAIKID